MNAYKHERTNIKPLRWFANGLEIVACELLLKSIRLAEKNKYGIRYYTYMGLQTILYVPATKWGTYYTVDKLPKRK
jgi:hypothetical protein